MSTTSAKRSVFEQGLKALVVTLAFFGATFGIAQSASAAPAQHTAVAIQAVAAEAAPSIAASWSCTNYFYTNAVERYCNVYSGNLRSYISCSNGYTYYSAWVGPGSWRIVQICPSGTSRVGSGVQTVG
jgi:hypothetical protein